MTNNNFLQLSQAGIMKAQQDENPWTRLIQGEKNKSSSYTLEQVLSTHESFRDASRPAQLTLEQYNFQNYSDEIEEYEEFDAEIRGIMGARNQTDQMQAYPSLDLTISEQNQKLLQRKPKKGFMQKIKKGSKNLLQRIVQTPQPKENSLGRIMSPLTWSRSGGKQQQQPQPQQEQQQQKISEKNQPQKSSKNQSLSKKQKHQHKQEVWRPQSVMQNRQVHSPVQQRSTSVLPQIIIESHASQDLVDQRYGFHADQQLGEIDIFFEAQQMLSDLEANSQLVEKERKQILKRLMSIQVEQSSMGGSSKEDWEKIGALQIERDALYQQLNEIDNVAQQMDVCVGELKGMIGSRDSITQNFSSDEARELQRVMVQQLLAEMEHKLKIFKENGEKIKVQNQKENIIRDTKVVKKVGSGDKQQMEEGIKRELSVRLAPLQIDQTEFYDCESTPRTPKYHRSQSVQSFENNHESNSSQMNRDYSFESSTNILRRSSLKPLTGVKSSPDLVAMPPLALQTSTACFPHQFGNDQDLDSSNPNSKQIQRDLSDTILYTARDLATSNQPKSVNLSQRYAQHAQNLVVDPFSEMSDQFVQHSLSVSDVGTDDPFSNYDLEVQNVQQQNILREKEKQENKQQDQVENSGGSKKFSWSRSRGQGQGKGSGSQASKSQRGLGLEISISQDIPDTISLQQQQQQQRQLQQQQSEVSFNPQLWAPLSLYTTPRIFGSGSPLKQQSEKERKEKRGVTKGDVIFEGAEEKEGYDVGFGLKDLAAGSNVKAAGEHRGQQTGGTQQRGGSLAVHDEGGIFISGNQVVNMQNEDEPVKKVKQKPTLQIDTSEKQEQKQQQASPQKPPQPPPTPPPRASTPPPPPPPKGRASPAPPPLPAGRSRRTSGTQSGVQKNRDVINMYQELRRSQISKGPRKNTSIGRSSEPVSKDALMAEIVGKSSYIEAVNRDIETRGDMVNELIRKVSTKKAKIMQELIDFVRDVDAHLSTLTDETAVLKAFEWPTARYDTFREACANFEDLQKLKSQMTDWKAENFSGMKVQEELAKVQSFQEQTQIKMDKMQRSRETEERRYKEHNIPWPATLYDEVIHSSLNLAAIYMKLVLSEVERLETPSKKVVNEEQELQARQKALMMLTNAVRFGFRVHQFAGGFDAQCDELFGEICARTRSSMPHNN